MLLGRVVKTPDGYKGAKNLRIAFREKVLIATINIIHARSLMANYHAVVIYV